MSAPRINEQDKKQLRENAKLKLEELEAIQSALDADRLIDDFKNKFNICESVYKVLLSEHQKRKGKQVEAYLKVDMRQVPQALRFAGYTFDRSLLNNLFGATGNCGHTVKKLRDAVTHGIDQNAVDEIKNRKEELFGYMNSFLYGIRSFDADAA